MTAPSDRLSFWEHLDALRAAIVRIVVLLVVVSVAAFCFGEELFAVVLAPRDADFVTYRLLGRIGALTGQALLPFDIRLINTTLAGQFVIHMKTALCAGVILSSPYALYQLYRFVSPALYARERRYAVRVVGWSYAMFLSGLLLSYFLIFPLTFRFLGTYQVDAGIANLIALDSYVSTLLVMSLALGIVFEIPVLSWLFARLGFLSAAFMRRYRKHAVVVILFVAAVITPTSDAFTLLLVALPMWLLYEASILIVARTRAQ